MSSLGLAVLCGVSATFFVGSIAVTEAQSTQVKNVILVHGAWADGSGWKGIYDILVNDGYKLSIVQEPETTFSDDVAATRRAIDQQDGIFGLQ
jgi:hypothetical protein